MQMFLQDLEFTAMRHRHGHRDLPATEPRQTLAALIQRQNGRLRKTAGQVSLPLVDGVMLDLADHFGIGKHVTKKAPGATRVKGKMAIAGYNYVDIFRPKR